MLTLANIASAIQDAFRHRVEIWRTPPAAAAGDEAGTGTDFHPWRWDTTEPGHLGRNAMPWF